MVVLFIIAVFFGHVSYDMGTLDMVVLRRGCDFIWSPLELVGLYFDVVVICHRCPSSAPASEEPENEDSKGEAEDDFTWKDVLKAVLRLRQNDKLSEGEPGAHEPKNHHPTFFLRPRQGGHTIIKEKMKKKVRFFIRTEIPSQFVLLIVCSSF